LASKFLSMQLKDINIQKKKPKQCNQHSYSGSLARTGSLWKIASESFSCNTSTPRSSLTRLSCFVTLRRAEFESSLCFFSLSKWKRGPHTQGLGWKRREESGSCENGRGPQCVSQSAPGTRQSTQGCLDQSCWTSSCEITQGAPLERHTKEKKRGFIQLLQECRAPPSLFRWDGRRRKSREWEVTFKYPKCQAALCEFSHHIRAQAGKRPHHSGQGSQAGAFQSWPSSESARRHPETSSSLKFFLFSFLFS